MRRLSSTVNRANRRRFSGICAMPRVPIRCAASPWSDHPSKCISPADNGIWPEIARSKVVLPAPFGPITATASFCLTSFFFSSRRRHTRSLCDWSSDVCSSDLVQDPELVPSAIAQALAISSTGGRRPIDALLEHLHDKRTLLVLDNFEQLLPAAPIAITLLEGSPGLRVLVSSRSVLRVYGEQEFPVPPLAVPDLKALPSLSALSQFEAVWLFIERAVAVKPDFRATNENAPAIAGICERVDGLPLAIELAAARIKLFSPQALLSRLEKSLTALGSGARDLPSR